MSKQVNILKAKEVLNSPFGYDFIYTKFGRTRDQVGEYDYLKRDPETDRWSWVTIEKGGRIGSDNFKNGNYDSPTTEEEEEEEEYKNNDNSTPLNPNLIKKPLKIFKHIQDFVEEKANKAIQKELKQYLKQYFKFSDSRIGKFMDKLTQKTKDLHTKFDKINLHKRLNDKIEKLITKKFQIDKETIIKNGLGDVTKFANKIFKGSFSDLLKTDMFEDLILGILLF